MDQKWNIMDMAQDIQEIVMKENIQTIITFDRQGISGHPNHINIYNALPMIHTLCPHVSIYSLQTHNIVRKYLHVFDCVLTLLERSDDNIITDVKTNYYASKAMENYPSQMVWFRRLYLMFSSYTRLNVLIPFK